MDQLRALQYFIAAAEEGSLAGAARRLDLSVPSVHKLIAALETRLGVALFERSSKGLRLTASGDIYLEASRPLLDELAALDEAVSSPAQRPSGTLVVAAHPQLAHHLLLPALPRFRARYPDIRIDFRVIHRLSDADAEMADVFLLHGWPEANDLVHRPLGQAQMLIAAAPAYWASHGLPQHPQDLTRHQCLLMRNPAGIVIDLWEFERGAEAVAVTASGWLSSNNREVVLEAALAGEGVVRLNLLTTRAHVLSGRLVPALSDWAVKGGPPLNLLVRPQRQRTPRVRLFVDFVNSLLQELTDTRLPGERQPIERPYWHRRGSRRASSVLRGGS